MHSKAIGKEVLHQQLKVTELAIDFPVCDNDSIVMFLSLQSIQIQIFRVLVNVPCSELSP